MKTLNPNFLTRGEQKRVERLSSRFEKVLATCRSEGNYLLIYTEVADILTPVFKYRKYVVGKRGGVMWIKKGNAYDPTTNQITDEGTQRYEI